MANRPPCKHLDHDFDPRHDACSNCGMTREKWRALDVSAAAVAQRNAAEYREGTEHSQMLADLSAGEFKPVFPELQAAQPNERVAFEAQWNVFLASGAHESDAYLMGWEVWQAARATAPQAMPIPIYQIGAPGIAGHQVVWWDVPQEEYERQRKAGVMRTGIVYREPSCS